MTGCSAWFYRATLGLMLVLPGVSGAALTGECSNCHTMHNSQQTTFVAFSRDASGQMVPRDMAFDMLLKTDCIGCHSNPGPATIVTQGETRTPIVLNLTEPTYPPNGSSTSTLAGGNFHWIAQGGDSLGHNVAGISGEDSRFGGGLAPGGVPVEDQCATCHNTLATADGGCEGCHVPAHHAAGPEVLAGQEQGWYRFLGSVMLRDGEGGAPAEGVLGIEDPDWEQAASADRHNTYQGSAGLFGSYLGSGSLTQKCSGCHGLFHRDTASGSAWIRHPVAVAIPDAGEFAEFATYEPLVPVARANVSAEDANFSTINRGSDMVSCVSCHRPHGSPYPAMLRWNYRAWPGIDPQTGQPAVNGCAVCHTAKD